ncbi:hypothetical protein N7449_004567 [Penicillium cf. viridicatum]|uniref:Uncharacterized protein n=1 Tax=Penicillium cf. viridicatum TaxID=2972119 RepID=A0A9W9SY41_9EURO|nr:hypothetical protein N7449_004567 [Penicillium cf. viridicatum]
MVQLVAAISVGPGGAGCRNSGRGVPRGGRGRGGGRGALHGAATGAPGLAIAPTSNPDIHQTPDARYTPLTRRDQSHNAFAPVHTPGLPSREAACADSHRVLLNSHAHAHRLRHRPSMGVLQFKAQGPLLCKFM